VKSVLETEMKSAAQANITSRAAMNALGFWSGQQEETCQDVSKAGMRKGSLSGCETEALDENVCSRQYV
jgi:hypothetical protein